MKIQQGYLTEKSGSWLGHYSKWCLDPATGIKRRRQKAAVLGLVSTMTRTKAREELRKVIVKELGMSGDGRMTVSGFIEQRWKPLREGTWRPSTKATNEEIFRVITERFGNEAVEDIDNVALQTWLNSIAKTRSGSAVKHIRIFLRSIFAEATEQSYIDKNPARLLKVPKLRTVKRPFLQLAEVKALLTAAKWYPRERALLRLILTTALRPSELFALKWENIDFAKKTMTLTATVYRGKLRAYTKTTEADESVKLLVPEQAIQALAEWHASKDDRKESDFIFPTASGTFWLKENYQRRVLSPLAKTAGIKHVNFQTLRRTTATHAAGLGTLKSVQAILRHKKAETTANNYMQVIDADVKDTGDNLAGVILQQ